MKTIEDAASVLRSLEDELRASNGNGNLEVGRMADQLHQVAQFLSDEDSRWIDSGKAERILGFTVEGAMPAWIRLGLLRSRTLPNGKVQVLLDDVLRRRAETEDLSAFGGGDELSSEELRILRETRPGTNPWERGEGHRSR